MWPSRIIERKFDLSKKNLRIAIWGLTYKKETNSIKNSPALENMKRLSSSCTFHVFDPIVKLPDLFDLPVKVYSEILDTLYGADALIIFNNSQIFSSVLASEIKKRLKGNLVIDPFGTINIDSQNGIDYIKLGT